MSLYEVSFVDLYYIKQIQRIYVPCHFIVVFEYMSYHPTTYTQDT